ncbi:MAG: Fic family protein [Candidatus Hydrogenedentes bacterium]|nr:Fic family protein [Candidatus Hydrogenedentota bacterium]
MPSRITGNFVDTVIYGDECRAFVPFPLPPEPPLSIDSGLQAILDEAHVALGRLDGAVAQLSDSSLFLYCYVRREAVLSSQIEGTQSSLSDFLLFESDAQPGVPLVDVTEVSNYVAALELGMTRIRAGEAITASLLRDLHAVLLRSGRGSEKGPGSFRIEPNWIGGSRPRDAVYVPPPNREVPRLIADLEGFISQKNGGVSAIVRSAMAHVQFETIHPFLDGNGRVGRLLFPLILCSAGILSQPMLYLSLFFKRNRQEYYALLQRVRLEGDWESWIHFAGRGIVETANSCVQLSRSILSLFESDNIRIQSEAGRRAETALRAFKALQTRPIVGLPELVRLTGLTAPTAASAMRMLESAGIVQEVTGRRYNKRYSYGAYVALINEGTELA